MMPDERARRFLTGVRDDALSRHFAPDVVEDFVQAVATAIRDAEALERARCARMLELLAAEIRRGG